MSTGPDLSAGRDKSGIPMTSKIMLNCRNVRFVTNKISLHEETIMPTTRKWEIQNSMFRTPVYCFSGLFKRSKHGSGY